MDEHEALNLFGFAFLGGQIYFMVLGLFASLMSRPLQPSRMQARPTAIYTFVVLLFFGPLSILLMPFLLSFRGGGPRT